MLQKIYDTPSRSKWTVRVVPASYNPRSNFLPLNIENTLWNQGSRLGNCTVEPLDTTSRWGSNALFFWPNTASSGFSAGESLAGCPAGTSQTTAEILLGGFAAP